MMWAVFITINLIIYLATANDQSQRAQNKSVNTSNQISNKTNQSFNLTEIKFDIYEEVEIPPHNWVFLISPIDFVVTSDFYNFQVLVQYVSQELKYSYGCLTSNPQQLPTDYNKLKKIKAHFTAQLLQKVTQDEINQCYTETKDNNDKNSDHLAPHAKFYFAFYSNNSEVQHFELINELSQSNNNSIDLKFIFIVLGVLGVMFLMCLCLMLYKYLRVDRGIMRSITRQSKRLQRKPPLEISTAPTPTGIDQYIQAVKFIDACNQNSDLKNCNECLICLLNFEKSSVVRVTRCSHVFHKNCLDQWFQRHKNCPLCRAKIDEKVTIESNKTSPISQSPVTHVVISQTNQSKSNLYISVNQSRLLRANDQTFNYKSRTTRSKQSIQKDISFNIKDDVSAIVRNPITVVSQFPQPENELRNQSLFQEREQLDESTAQPQVKEGKFSSKVRFNHQQQPHLQFQNNVPESTLRQPSERLRERQRLESSESIQSDSVKGIGSTVKGSLIKFASLDEPDETPKSKEKFEDYDS